ncbi:hypothetical protein niasHT_006114 [Heterodera trifolii]|uniref:Uncharacterized protein n=1 Tax=Heterodera trifolii TaxID=157864 RepID=A0ABD2M6M9_9BILA
MAKEFRLEHHFEQSFLDAPPPPPCASKLAHPGSAAMARGGPRRPDDGMVGRGPRQWREGVRADDRQNGGEGAAAVERGCPWKRGGPWQPRRRTTEWWGGVRSSKERGSVEESGPCRLTAEWWGGGRCSSERGSVEERGSAPTDGRMVGRGPRQ